MAIDASVKRSARPTNILSVISGTIHHGRRLFEIGDCELIMPEPTFYSVTDRARWIDEDED